MKAAQGILLSLIHILMVFDQIMALTKGGPAQSTESISYLIYNNGMSGGQFGFQSANAVIFFIVIVIISAAQLTITCLLYTSVTKNWRDSDFLIKNFGYDKKEI